MARKADQELGDATSSTAMFYKENSMDMMKQHYPVFLLIIILIVIFWKYGLRKL